MADIGAFFSTLGLSPIEYALAALILIAMPIEAEIYTRVVNKRHERDDKNIRVKQYVYTITSLWVVAFIILGVWAYEGRPWSELGFQFHNGIWSFVALAVAVAMVLFFGTMAFLVRRKGATRNQYREALEKAGDQARHLPINQREYKLFNLMSVTAGITEEIIFRGYLIWLLSLALPIAAAAIISWVFFVLMHRYQGWSSLPQIGGLAAIVTAIYIATGSLYVVIVLHILVDILVGATVWAIRPKT